MLYLEVIEKITPSGIIVTHNTAPYFTSPPDDVEMEAGSLFVFTLPDIVDNESDQVDIEVEMGLAQNFVSFYRSNKQFLVLPSSTDNTLVGSYRI